MHRPLCKMVLLPTQPIDPRRGREVAFLLSNRCSLRNTPCGRDSAAGEPPGVRRSPRQGQPGQDGGRAGVGQAGHQRLAGRGGIEEGRLLRRIRKGGEVGESLSDWAVWDVVRAAAEEIGVENFGAHDLCRTCAKLCRKAGAISSSSSSCSGTRPSRRQNGISGPSRRSLSQSMTAWPAGALSPPQAAELSRTGLRHGQS